MKFRTTAGLGALGIFLFRAAALAAFVYGCLWLTDEITAGIAQDCVERSEGRDQEIASFGIYGCDCKESEGDRLPTLTTTCFMVRAQARSKCGPRACPSIIATWASASVPVQGISTQPPSSISFPIAPRPPQACRSEIRSLSSMVSP